MELIYGTGNPAKFQAMERALQDFPIELISITKAAEEKGIKLPEVRESGNDPLENAKIKAEAYYGLLKKPVFSCDSGLYLWNDETGEMLPEEEQPGIHVRGRGKRRLTDEELILHYTGLARKYGPIRARYKNGICLILDRQHIYMSMEEALWGDPFLLADHPHPKRIPGFPLDSISLEIASGQYYYDLKDDAQDIVAASNGFRIFFQNLLKNVESCDK